VEEIALKSLVARLQEELRDLPDTLKRFGEINRLGEQEQRSGEDNPYLDPDEIESATYWARRSLENSVYLLDILLSSAPELAGLQTAFKNSLPSEVLDHNWGRGEAGEPYYDFPAHNAVERFFELGIVAMGREVAVAGLAKGQAGMNTRKGSVVGIGHGRSPLWRELKDFLADRLHLTVEEFNSVPTAGLATVERLAEMLDGAAFAFLVMTGEDEQADGKVHARLNVVHEAGLFQGRLGFKKAILLLEEGCEEFSNIHGLGQLRFPKGNMASQFEEIRRVLERERIIPAGRRLKLI
jgi:predicted nucleotide-binding protein